MDLEFALTFWHEVDQLPVSAIGNGNGTTPGLATGLEG
jgi:hypothetical protein